MPQPLQFPERKCPPPPPKRGIPALIQPQRAKALTAVHLVSYQSPNSTLLPRDHLLRAPHPSFRTNWIPTIDGSRGTIAPNQGLGPGKLPGTSFHSCNGQGRSRTGMVRINAGFDSRPIATVQRPLAHQHQAAPSTCHPSSILITQEHHGH
jgi:hypothetical protein